MLRPLNIANNGTISGNTVTVSSTISSGTTRALVVIAFNRHSNGLGVFPTVTIHPVGDPATVLATATFIRGQISGSGTHRMAMYVVPETSLPASGTYSVRSEATSTLESAISWSVFEGCSSYINRSTGASASQVLSGTYQVNTQVQGIYPGVIVSAWCGTTTDKAWAGSTPLGLVFGSGNLRCSAGYLFDTTGALRDISWTSASSSANNVSISMHQPGGNTPFLNSLEPNEMLLGATF